MLLIGIIAFILWLIAMTIVLTTIKILDKEIKK